MYYVIINNYQEKYQQIVFSSSDYFCCKDFCENYAREQVTIHEGVKYDFNKYLFVKKRKEHLPEGYSCVQSKDYFPKFTIFYKEANGYLYHGKLKKLKTVYIVKIPTTPPKIRTNKCPKIVMENFKFVLDELLDSVVEFDQQTPI